MKVDHVSFQEHYLFMFSLLLLQSSYMTCFQMKECKPKLIILGTFYHYYKFVNIVKDSNLLCSFFHFVLLFFSQAFLSNCDSNGYRSRSWNTQPPDQSQIKNNSNIQFQICLKYNLKNTSVLYHLYRNGHSGQVIRTQTPV